MATIIFSNDEEFPKEFITQYQTLLMEAMALNPTTAKHTYVLHHIMGYFKKRLSADEKQEILEIVEQYRNGLIPLIVPVTLMNHYVRKYDEAYLKDNADHP
ncbi:MAG: YbgA family protein [Deltaproteobacteria bacterium]|nr:YbgA family protein [Deltaproteobacteria bacterium]